MNKVTCRKCGNEYSSIGQHWTKAKDCSHPKLTEEQIDVATGLILGDGTLSRNYKNAIIQVKMVNEPYLKYLDQLFGIFSLGCNLYATADKQAERNRNSGFHLEASADNYQDVYRWMTRAHPQFNQFRSWYSNGEKVFAEDLNITPTLLKHWYVCDGDKQSKRVRIASTNENKNLNKLKSYFHDCDIPSPETSGDRIYWSTQDSKKVFDFMGEPLPGFEYKWP